MTPLRLVPPSGPPIEIDRDQAVLGRDNTADVVVNDVSVSRRHGRVERRGAEWYFVDLGSANGTFVDGQRVRDVALRHGQELKLGSAAFRVEGPGSTAATVLIAAPQPSPSTPLPPPPVPPPPPYASVPPPPPVAAPPPAPYYAAPAPPPAAAASGGVPSWVFLLVAAAVGAKYVLPKMKGESAPAPQSQNAPQQPGGGAPAGGGGGGQRPAAPQGAQLQIQTKDVQKSGGQDGGAVVAIKIAVTGFQTRQVQNGFQVSLVQDLQTLAPNGEPIPSLSKQAMDTVDTVVQSAEDLAATFEATLTFQRFRPGSYTARFTVRDQLGNTAASHDVAFDLP